MGGLKIRSYDREFKLNAVKLYLGGNGSYSKISRELGVPAGTLVTWVRSHKAGGIEAFSGKGNLKAGDVEMANLRKELSIVKEERDILKKALGIFSSQKK